MKGDGCRVKGEGLRVKGEGLRIKGSGFIDKKVKDQGLRVTSDRGRPWGYV